MSFNHLLRTLAYLHSKTQFFVIPKTKVFGKVKKLRVSKDRQGNTKYYCEQYLEVEQSKKNINKSN